MGFWLTMLEGKEAGREFVFAQPSVTIGRTSECDIVLFDPGVSRKHARIFGEGGAYFVEDLGSSNGTKVNGVVVKRQQLAAGDAVALGPVVFTFSPSADGTSDEDPTRSEEPAGVPIANSSTRLVGRSRAAAAGNLALVPPGADDEELEVLGKHKTASLSERRGARSISGGSMRVAARRRSALESDAADEDESDERTEADEGELGRDLEDATRPRRLTPGGTARPVRTQSLTAAERARLRREHPGARGRLLLFWYGSSTAARALFVLFGIASVLALSGLVGYFGLGLHASQAPLPPEPTRLGREPLPHAFGLGPSVDYVRPDMKEFDFEFTAPVRAVVLLRFQSRDISTNEVSVSVNGSSVGFVPADTVSSTERSLEVVVPASLLKPGERNQVVFDNVKNPPGQERWRIWKPWIDVVLLPEGIPVPQLRKEAEEAFSRGQLAFERRDVGASNRYEAWREFRSAWLLLEGHPEPRPELYMLAREAMKRAQLELDRVCAKLVLEVQRDFNQGNVDAVGSTLEHMRDYFPNKDQPCYFRPDEIRLQLDL